MIEDRSQIEGNMVQSWGGALLLSGSSRPWSNRNKDFSKSCQLSKQTGTSARWSIINSNGWPWLFSDARTQYLWCSPCTHIWNHWLTSWSYWVTTCAVQLNLSIFTHSSNQCSVIQYLVWSTDSYIRPVSGMDEVDRVHACWASSLCQYGQKLLWIWAVWTVWLYSLWSFVLHQWGKK